MAPTYPCLKCEKQVAKNAKALRCSLCNLYVHISCTAEISDEVYNFMKTQESCGLKWFCHSCRIVNDKFQNDMVTLNARIDKVEDSVNVNTMDIVALKKDVEICKSDKAEEGERQNARINGIQSEVFEEIQERERRKHNLILHNIPEPDSNVTVGKERKEADIKLLSEVLLTLDPSFDYSQDVKFMHRIGEKNDKVRPITLSFKKIDRKDVFVTEAHKLEGTEFSNTSISIDLTKRQRNEQRDMESEASKRNNALSEEDFLKYEWIVTGPRGNKRIVRVPRDRQKKARKRTIHEVEEDSTLPMIPPSQRMRSDLP